MGKDLNIKYLDYLHNTEAHKQALLDDSETCANMLRKRYALTPEGNIFHFKNPHSRRIKLSRDYSNLREEIILKDNQIATANELLMQHVYRRHGIMTAEHYPVNMHDLCHNIEKVGVISENFLGTDIEYTTLYDLFCMNNSVSVYKNKANLKYQNLNKERIQTLELDAPVLDILGGCSKLEHLLDYKYYFLQIMTEKCFDEIIISHLLSVFDFSDDDHLMNAYLCKKSNEELFDGLYLFDKESASFILPIAMGGKINSIKRKTFTYNNYNGNIKISNYYENYNDRRLEILRLARLGKLDKKYLDVLKQVSNTDYDALSKKVQEDYNFKPNDIQIDMLKFGSEQAGIIIEKCL